MKKKLTIDYYPVEDPKNNNPLIAQEEYKDCLRMSVNGVAVTASPVNLALEQYFYNGWSLEKTVDIHESKTNTISLLLEQHYNNDKLVITGTTSFSPVSDTKWEVSYTYDWRQVTQEKLELFDKMIKVEYEGFKFQVNGETLNNVKKCLPGALYTNSTIITWNGIDPLDFSYEEAGISTGGDTFIQAFKYMLT